MKPLTTDLQALYQRAVQLQNALRQDEAETAYRELLGRAPDCWPAWYNLGVVLQAKGALGDAEAAYRNAIAGNAKLAEAHNNLGNVVRALGRAPEAVSHFRRALENNPALAQAACNLGQLLLDQREFDRALPALRKALQLDPANAATWEALWRCLVAMGRSDEACRAFLQWERAAPLTPERVLAGLNSARPLADPAREAAYLKLAIEWPFPRSMAAQLSPVLGLLQYFDLPREDLLAAYRRYDALLARESRTRVPVEGHPADGRIRIGYVSGDFREHVMGRLMWEVLSRHDRTRFALELFSLAKPQPGDALTARFQAMADGFHDLSSFDDEQAALAIAARGIDVLVDLGGHTMSARPEIHAHRPAPHIVTHLGYHGALGMSFIDGKISDAVADPPGNEAFQVEPPLRLDACVFPLVATPVPASVPIDCPEPLRGRVVFAAFTNVLKLSPRCLAVWKRVLDRVDNGMLLFSPFSRADRAGLEAVCAAAGIGRERIHFLDMDAGDARLPLRYRLAHAVLDTFPYAGGDTTLAALAMGVPVVTLAGQRHAERIGASMLTHLGITDLIADNETEFIDIAVRVATDGAYRADLQQRISSAMQDSDRHVTRHTRALEAEFERLAAMPPA